MNGANAIPTTKNAQTTPAGEGDSLVDFARRIASYRDIVLGNVIRIGEVPSTEPDVDVTVDPFLGNQRAKALGDRFLEIGLDECTVDDSGNPVGIVKGGNPDAPAILVCSEIDSKYLPNNEYHYTVSAREIAGPGILDNAIGAAALPGLADIMRMEGVHLESDLYLVGFANTMAQEGDYGSIGRFLENFGRPVRGAVLLKGGELGRLNYYTRATVRGDIVCTWKDGLSGPNMNLAAHEIIDRLLSISFPLKPRAELEIGKIQGGVKYGTPAESCLIGFELRCDNDEQLARYHAMIERIATGADHEMDASVRLTVRARRGSTNLGFDHPLTQTAFAVMAELGIQPAIRPSHSELHFFLQRGIPALTVGLTKGEHYHTDEAVAKIDPLLTGLAQVYGLVRAIDGGVCDA